MKYYHLFDNRITLSSRPYYRLLNGGIDTVEKLVQMTPREILRMRNIGRKSFHEIIAALKEAGIAYNAGEFCPHCGKRIKN